MNKKRLFLTLGLVFAGLLAVFAIAAVLVTIYVLVPMVKERVVSEARARGIELGFNDVEVSWNHLSVYEARFRLVGVNGLAGTVERIDITTSGFEPTGIVLEKLHLELLGSVPSLILETTEWTKNYPQAYNMPLRADPVSVRWRTVETQAPWLTVAEGTVGRKVDGGNFIAKSAVVAGTTLSPISTHWTKKTGHVELGLGQPDIDAAKISVDVDFAKERPTATVVLKPTPTDSLAKPLGVELPVEGVTVSSNVTLQFANKQGTGPVTGTMNVTLDGYIPPHPRELDGFVFGKATLFKSDFEVTEDRKTVHLTKSTVKAGAFELKGHGLVQRHPDHAEIHLEYQGALGCAALAGAAAETYLGQVLSKLPKVVAKQTLQGAVGVTVKVVADTRDLKNAQVLRLIGIGCGLKPLRIPTPEELEAFARELPGFVGALPSLAEKFPLPGGLPAPPPSALLPPNLPLPKIEFKKGTPQQREATDAKATTTGESKKE